MSGPQAHEHDVVVVGGSLAGCAAAIFFARAGMRVALVEKQPDPRAYKRICTHFIQGSAIPTLERLGLLDSMLEAGALRWRGRMWTQWGWIEAPAERVGVSLNLRREILDPLVRGAAMATLGVESLLGRTAVALRRAEGGGEVTVRDREGGEATLRGRLVVGADGRESRIAELAGLEGKTLPHGRLCYAAHFEGPDLPGAPDPMAWFLDPDFVVAAPTDSGLTLYGVMPTKDRAEEFKRDPGAAIVEYIAAIPEPPPIRESRRAGPIIGKVEMPNRVRGPVAPGLALVGDAALASDPLAGIGCGWAFQSAEWLADGVAPALRGEEPLKRGLARYRRRHRHELRGHMQVIHSLATGRRLNRAERTFFAGAARDPELAVAIDAFLTRRAKPGRTFARALPQAFVVNARHALG